MRIAAVLAVAGGLAACTRIEAIPVSPAALVTLTAASAAPVVETTPDDTPPPRYEVERLDGRLIRVYRPFGVWVSTGSTVFRLADPVRATISDDRLLLESRGHQRVSVPLGAVTAVELRQPRFDGRRTAINAGIVAGVAVLCAVAGVLLMSSAGAH